MSKKMILLVSFVLSCLATLVMASPSFANGTAEITSLTCSSISIKGTFDKKYLAIDVMNSDIPGGWEIGFLNSLTSADGTFDVTIPFTAPVPNGTNLFVVVHDQGESPYDWSSIAELKVVAYCSDGTPQPTVTPIVPPITPTPYSTPIPPTPVPTSPAPAIMPSVHLTCSSALISGRTGVAAPFVRITIVLASNLTTTLDQETVRVRNEAGARFHAHLRFPRQPRGTRLIIAVGEWDGSRFLRPATFVGQDCR